MTEITRSGCTWETLDTLVREMRPEDRTEMRLICATPGVPPELEFRKRAAGSILQAWHVDDKLACVAGIVTLSGVGPRPLLAPWLLGTPVLERHAVSLTRGTKKWLAELQRLFGADLAGLVWIGNALHVRWLKRAEFIIHDPAPTGFAVFERPYREYPPCVDQ